MRDGMRASGGRGTGASPRASRRAADGAAREDAVRRGRGGSRVEGGPRSASARREAPVLAAPVTVRSLAEHPRVAGRYRVRCVGVRAVGEPGGTGDDAFAGEAHARAPHEGESVLVVGAAAIADFALRPGLVLDEGAWQRLQREGRVVAAQDRALRTLAAGRRSERDLSVRLRRHEPDAAVVGEAIARLRALGLVDDAEFAVAEATARLRRGTVATGDVRRRLRQRGVAADVVDEAIAAAADEFEVDDAARCREAASKRVRQLASLAPDVARRRLAGWLMRRGFAPGLVAETVRRVLPRGGGVVDEADVSLDGEDC